jgi:hypothetical protein
LAPESCTRGSELLLTIFVLLKKTWMSLEINPHLGTRTENGGGRQPLEQLGILNNDDSLGQSSDCSTPRLV